jgi:NAD(P)-dependent dehydrogenase (short-subunit alcohol dehydrogenase family)
LLRPGLLDGVSIVLAGPPAPAAPVAPAAPEPEDSSPGVLIAATCADLGARVLTCELGDGTGAGEPPSDSAVEDATRVVVDRALGDAGHVELLAVDGAALFAHAALACDGPDAGREALRVCLEASWNVTRAVANRAFLAAGRGGRIVYLAPPCDGGEHADAARAGLENLARTLSVEWARHAITAVTIAPAAATSLAAGTGAAQVATLIAYIGSPAGAYFSGCLLDLGGTGGGGQHRAAAATNGV